MTDMEDPGPGRPGHVCPNRSMAGRCRCKGGSEALKAHYATVRGNSLAKLKEAIASLRSGPQPGPVSLDSIHVRSVMLRGAKGESGIAVSTILDDPACAAIYYAERTRNPLAAPPPAGAPRGRSTGSRRKISRELRSAKAENVRLRRDIASIGGARARADRKRVDGDEPE